MPKKSEILAGAAWCAPFSEAGGTARAMRLVISRATDFRCGELVLGMEVGPRRGSGFRTATRGMLSKNCRSRKYPMTYGKKSAEIYPNVLPFEPIEHLLGCAGT